MSSFGWPLKKGMAVKSDFTIYLELYLIDMCHTWDNCSVFANELILFSVKDLNFIGSHFFDKVQCKGISMPLKWDTILVSPPLKILYRPLIIGAAVKADQNCTV